MNWVKKRRLLFVGAIVITIVIALSIIYIVHENTKPYKTIIVRDPLCSYSITYPNHLKKSGPDYDPNPPIPSSILHLNLEDITVEYGDSLWTYSPGGITFDVYKPDISPFSAREKLEDVLELRSDRNEFQLIEKKSITIDGFEGYEAAYTYKHLIKAAGFKTERKRTSLAY